MAYKTIAVLGDPIVKEATANATITPGHLIERMSTAGKVRVHATAGGSAQKMFALEAGGGKTIDDDYAEGDQVQVGIFQSGQEVWGILADGENASLHSKLESAGDGTLRVVDVDASCGEISLDSIVGEALTAVDMSDSSGADPSPRILVEIW